MSAMRYTVAACLLALALVQACPTENLAADADVPVVATDFPKIENNEYKITFLYKTEFKDISVTFDDTNTECNLAESDFNGASHWTTTGTPDGSCQLDAAFTRNVQNMLANCGFTANAGSYKNTIKVTTRQERTVTGTGASEGREQNYTQIKNTEFEIEITIPTSITVNSTAQVFGNVTVLRAVINQFVNVSSTGENPVLQFQLLTSSQVPYQLQYLSTSLGNPSDASTYGTISGQPTIVNTKPDCASGNALACEQTFDLYGMSITNDNGNKCTLDQEDFTVNFSVNCTDDFFGNNNNGSCISPNPSLISVTLRITSSNYCPQTSTEVLTPSITTYNASARAHTTTQYVVGSTVYGTLQVQMDNQVATVDNVVINKITTTADGTKDVYDDSQGTNPGVALSVTINTDNTVDDDKCDFDIPLTNGGTVILDAGDESAQGMTISIEGTIEFSAVAAKLERESKVIQDWYKRANSKSTRMQLSSTRSRSTDAETLVSLVPTVATEPAPTSGSGTSSSASAMTVIGVVGAVAVIGAIVAYRRGRRKGAVIRDHQKSGQESTELTKSSSTVDVNTV